MKKYPSSHTHKPPAIQDFVLSINPTKSRKTQPALHIHNVGSSQPGTGQQRQQIGVVKNCKSSLC